MLQGYIPMKLSLLVGDVCVMAVSYQTILLLTIIEHTLT